MTELKALQESADKNKYVYDHVDASLLERFPKPSSQCEGGLQLQIEVPEFKIGRAHV